MAKKHAAPSRASSQPPAQSAQPHPLSRLKSAPEPPQSDAAQRVPPQTTNSASAQETVNHSPHVVHSGVSIDGVKLPRNKTEVLRSAQDRRRGRR